MIATRGPVVPAPEKPGETLEVLTPAADDWALARAIHGEFRSKPGARHIASEFALAHLSALLSARACASVLEVGAGIGTISRLLLSHRSRIERIVATEFHPYCLGQLGSNLGDERDDRFELIDDPVRLQTIGDDFDLVIIDGLITTNQLHVIGAGTLCFIEGSRKATRRDIARHLAERGLRCDFTNFHRGIRYCCFERPRAHGRRRRWPKFRWRKVLKGCYIGAVAPIAPQPGR